MSDLKADIESAKFEITRLENKVTQLEKENEMLVMYNGDLKKIKADAVREFKEALFNASKKISNDEHRHGVRCAIIFTEDYADKLERGDV